MKNINVLPIDCTIANLLVIGGKLNLIRSNYYSKSYVELHNYEAKAMYITSDEEIKEGDWYLYGSQLVRANGIVGFHPTIIDSCKKIILTTDQDLIKDGIQAIDDEFLEWFVKNPSCEFVKIGQGYFKNNYDLSYKIIIPKEEPKQTDWKKVVMEVYGGSPTDFTYEKPKQETLEEVAERLNFRGRELFALTIGSKWQQELERGITITNVDKQEILEEYTDLDSYTKGLVDGAKFQKERSYSEELEKVEAMLVNIKLYPDMYQNGAKDFYNGQKALLEQFKKEII